MHHELGADKVNFSLKLYGKAAYSGRSAADRGQHGEAAGVAAEGTTRGRAGRKPLVRARAIEVIAKPRAVCSGHPRLFMQHRFRGSLLLCLVSTNSICMVL